MHLCRFCQHECNTHSLLANHIRWHHKREQSQRKCRFCNETFNAPNLVIHERSCGKPKIYNSCKQCGTATVNEQFCSRRCCTLMGNKLGTIGYKAYRRNNGIQRQITYRDICFQRWEKRCALCEWDKCLDVHHVNDDHNDNSPHNLIPLCQNHHTLTRVLEYRDEIRKQIDDKIRERLGL